MLIPEMDENLNLYKMNQMIKENKMLVKNNEKCFNIPTGVFFSDRHALEFQINLRFSAQCFYIDFRSTEIN